MITTIKHTFLPLPHAYAQIHHNFKKKISIPNSILSRKTMAGPHVFKHPFSSSQKVKTLLVLSNVQIMYNRTLRCATEMWKTGFVKQK